MRSQRKSLKHPGFYRYHSKESFNRYIDSVKATITDSLTGLYAYLKLKPIIARIGCLHTGIALPPEYTEYLNAQANLFPIALYFTGTKAFVLKNYSTTTGIFPKDEIVSINGKSMAEIISELLPLIPSDGYNLTMKYRTLYYSFPLWYRTIHPCEEYTLVIKQNTGEKVYGVKGMKFNELSAGGFLKEPRVKEQLEFEVKNTTGILTIHSFAASDIKSGNQDFASFMDKTFATLKQNKIQNLVVDLRDNTGGSDENAVRFASYFFNKPFRYWDRIEVTEPVAKEIKGPMLKLYYRKPIQQDSLWLWRKARMARDFDFYEERQPAKSLFNGKTFLLINGFCMSSCSDVIAVLSYNSKAVCIGEETGGGYQGNTSGIIPKTGVPPFKFSLSVPLQKYVNSVDPAKNIGHGTIPEYPVVPTLDEILNGKDPEMDLAFRLIDPN